MCNVEFQINARWLLDLEEYNEWMNEEDYVVEEEVGELLLSPNLFLSQTLLLVVVCGRV